MSICTAKNEKITEKLADQKIDSYCGGSKNDFALEGEITITITLSEYRKLVQEFATKKYDIEKAETDKYTREARNRELENEVSELKQKLFAYIETYGKIENDEENK